MQNKNTIEMLKMEFSTFRTFLAGAMEKANSISEVLNQMEISEIKPVESTEKKIEKMLMESIDAFIDENDSDIENDLEYNVLEAELEVDDRTDNVNVYLKKSTNSRQLRIVLRNTLTKFIEDSFYGFEQEKGQSDGN